ncbi:hypothetical protein BJ993_001351 [Nocardioides aromaticivorans]|uniref:Lipoprotein n=1 Tax=Nocardioides aromaticivorans TaxID=200618 RepID=A0A7Y9ZFX6_9ACTN|nr:hypothetical protein [Nocardioides aromaticivorans]NYI44271.1 hypothetical protein [Nocardioides aromaticivorans]
MRRTFLRTAPALLLLVPLAACGDDDPAAPDAAPLGDGIAWRDGATVHFPGGEEVDSGQEDGQAWRTSDGVVITSWDGGTVYVTPDGSVSDLDIPEEAQVAADPTQSVVAWAKVQPGDGVVHVLDPATGKERAAISTDYDDATELSIEGDRIWLHSSELASTLEIDWPSGKVTRSPLKYVRSIGSRYAVVEGGNENYVEAGAAKPGVIDLETRRMVLRGWDWGLSPRNTYATRELSDGDASTADTRIGVLDLATGKYVARLAARPDDSNWLNWAWTLDEKTIYWFEGNELVQCASATFTCTRSKVDATFPSVL